MNIAARYPIIYWNTACLSVDASAINAQDFYNLVDDDILEIDEIEGKRVQNKMDYAKIASALDKFKHISKIELPDINKSRLSFTPNVEQNSILYGLKGISKVTEPSINEIMMNRPFSSFKDFLNRVTKRVLTKDKIINLIKCGAFNKIENKTAKEILEDFIWTTCEPKNRLTMQNANMLIEHNLFPEELKYNCEVYKLTKELRKHRDSNKIWYIGSETIIPEEKAAEWVQIIQDSKIDIQTLMIEDRECRVFDSKRWDNFYEVKMAPMKNFIKNNHDMLLKALNQDLFNQEFEKYASGTEVDWELDSMNFYFNEHPLKKILPQLPVAIDPVWTIVEGRSDGFFFIKGKEIPKMHLFTIAGTVIDRDSTKGLVTVQTPDGVVTVKCYKDLYALYAQDKVEFDKYGNKIVLEESFFEKGVHLLITGIQRGATFVPKVYKNTGRRSIERIILDDEGNFKELIQKGE